MYRLLCLAFLALAACAAPSATEVPQRRAVATEALPPMKIFSGGRGEAPARSNADMVRDILDLEFQMESGRAVPMLTRFVEPVTIAMTGPVPATAGPDLARLIARLRAEAGIDIRQTAAPAAITVQFLPRRQLQAVVPQAACFVVPRVSSWAEYRQARRSDKVDWTTLKQRETVAIFIPTDTSPQEVRDCLHEEIAQALGPLNDLYRLPDSVFNDDNFHTVLTGFDMLVLRIHYAPELQNGMTRDQVAARLPALLDRMNPAGRNRPATGGAATPRAWIDAVETALGPRASQSQRRAAALRALSIARSQGWQDARVAFSYFAVGRLSQAQEIEAAVTAFAEAARLYRTLPGAQVHAAHVDMQMAAFALSSGQADEAIRLVNRAAPAVAEAENAALLATLLMIKAEALEMAGRPSEARAVRLDSLGWARYGFGSDAQVRARMSEIVALSPRLERTAAR